MTDLTILYLSNSLLPEKWTEFHKKALLETAGQHQIISMTRVPVDFGINVLQTEPQTKSNIFWQMLKGSHIAKTKYIAVAEDDTLYPPGHFDFYRPDDDVAAFNQHRWSAYTWGKPTYSLKNFIRTNATYIGTRELTIKALEERFKKYPPDTENMPAGMSGEIGMKKAEQEIGVTVQKSVDIKSELPVVQFDHDFFTVFDANKETIDRRHNKKLGTIQAYDIPHWGKVEDLVNKFI